jgi:hypothetical protein
MPRFKIVIADARVAHEKEIERNVAANLRAHRVDRMNPADAVRATTRITQRVREMFGRERPAGTVHADATLSDCPDGLPNCRNCGDPDHAATCTAAGHCPACGTAHGIAPDRILTENGYRLEPA